MKVDIKPKELITKKTDARGRLTLGTEYGDKEVTVLVVDENNTPSVNELLEQWREEAQEYHDEGRHTTYNVSQRRADQLERVVNNE